MDYRGHPQLSHVINGHPGHCTDQHHHRQDGLCAAGTPRHVAQHPFVHPGQHAGQDAGSQAVCPMVRIEVRPQCQRYHAQLYYHQPGALGLHLRHDGQGSHPPAHLHGRGSHLRSHGRREPQQLRAQPDTSEPVSNQPGRQCLPHGFGSHIAGRIAHCRSSGSHLVQLPGLV